ncbi:unnamed protein product, partial [Symbiodinium necroappetens]
MPLYQPAVLQKNYGDGQVKTKLLFEATKIPPDVKTCPCGEKATTAFGCPKCATVFRPLRKQNKRFNSEGLKLSATIRDAVLEYPIADYEAHDPTYIDLVEEETIANDKVGTPFLLRYGVTTSKEVPHYRKNAKAVDVDSLMKIAAEFGVTTKKKFRSPGELPTSSDATREAMGDEWHQRDLQRLHANGSSGTLALGAVAGPGLRPARLLSLRLRLPSVPVEPKRGQGQGRGRGKSSGSNNRGESQNTREYERWKADHARMLAAEEAQRRAETRLQE